MEDLRLTSFEDFQDKNFGKIGTPERDALRKKWMTLYKLTEWGKLFYNNKRAESYKAKKCALSFQPFMG